MGISQNEMVYNERDVLKMEPLLSILIPTYNRSERLKATIVSLLKMIEFNKLNEIELIISDNNSSDGTQQVLESFGDSISSFKQSSNLGYDGNVSFLFTKAKGTFVMFLADDDILLESGFISLISAIRDNSTVDCFLLNFFEGSPSGNDRFAEISDNLTSISLLGNDYFKYFVFLSGFVIKNTHYNCNDYIIGSYFTQIDIALQILKNDSIIYVHRDFVVERIVPDINDETGCNILDETYKIYLGFSKICRIHQKNGSFTLPFLFEVYQILTFIKDYIQLPNRKLARKISVIYKSLKSVPFKYRIRLVFVPYIVFRVISKKLLSKMRS